jgi:RNA polymerase sigma-70 factor (ECF subfamily)
VSVKEISGNLFRKPASIPMSSLSGAQFEAKAPAPVEGNRELEMLRKAQQGDRGAYGQLVVLYQDRLYNAVLRLIGDREEARELTQEAFTRGLMKLHSFRGDASPYTWLFRIAVNLAISQLRKIQRHRVFSLSAPGRNGNGHHGTDDQASSLVDRLAAKDASPPPRDLEDREQAEEVIKALGRLDAEYRAVLVMRDIEGFDYQQMADVLGLPLGTLKSRLFRARLALRDELAPYLGAGR